jgi:hypothetical protein
MAKPLDIPLEGTRGDDLYFTFNSFQINGIDYPVDATVTLYAVNKKDNTITMTGPGTLAGSSVTFKIPNAETGVAGKYTYDVQVDYIGGDKFTHIKSTLVLYDDVNPA